MLRLWLARRRPLLTGSADSSESSSKHDVIQVSVKVKANFHRTSVLIADAPLFLTVTLHLTARASLTAAAAFSRAESGNVRIPRANYWRRAVPYRSCSNKSVEFESRLIRTEILKISGENVDEFNRSEIRLQPGRLNYNVTQKPTKRCISKPC